MSIGALRSDNHDSWTRDMHAALARKFTNAGARLQPQSQQYVSNDQINPSHLSTSFQRPQSAPESVVSDTASSLRNSRKARNEIRKSLHLMLNAAVPARVVPAKEIARHVESSIDTIEARRQGNIPTAWAELVEYCRAYPAFGMEVLELMGIDIDQDRTAFALFLQLQQQVRR